MLTIAILIFLGLCQGSAAVAGGATGCGKSHHVGYHNNSSHGFSVPPGNRTYTIHIPSSYNIDKASPLIISYHGNGGTSDIQYALSEFGNETYNPDMIAVFPQGVKGHWQGASYATPGVDDLKFAGDLLDHIQSEYCIDSARIYANGKSVGGGFTNLLACSPVGDRFAAFAICESYRIISELMSNIQCR
jgi:poly(3-hydroxybutyrate) depolymerase